MNDSVSATAEKTHMNLREFIKYTFEYLANVKTNLLFIELCVVHCVCVCPVLRFITKLRKWGWTATQATQKFEECLADPAIAKGLDEEGFQTVAKYSKITLSSSRELKHSKQVEKTDTVEATFDQLGEVMQTLGESANLHKSTNLFDISAMPALPSLQELSSCNKFLRGKAKAKPKSKAKNRPVRKTQSAAIKDGEPINAEQAREEEDVELALTTIKQSESKKKWVARPL